MSTATIDSPQTAAGPRGSTHFADRVVEKIAGRAAAEVSNVTAPPPTGLARLTGAREEPDTKADVDGSTVELDIRLAIRYPASIRAVSREVQQTVRARVHDLTGLDVSAVRVNVVSLPARSASRARVI